MLNYLPEELLIEILSRVPAKSLVKFLLVSKSWYSLITSPNFTMTHLNNVRRQKIPGIPPLLLSRRYLLFHKEEHYTMFSDDEQEGGGDSGRIQDFARTSIELDCPLKAQIGYARVVGTCDGLVCLSDDLFGIQRRIDLWNPSIRKYLELPPPTIEPPSPFMFVLGFGVDSHGDYKVVRIVYHKDEQLELTVPFEVEVYSVSLGFWRRIVNVPSNVYIREFSWTQVFLNGVVHWISYCPSKGGSVSSLILGFDMENDLFNEIMLPDKLSCIQARRLVINVYRGDLAVIRYHRSVKLSIWVMKQYGVFESWTRLFAIDLGEEMARVVGFKRNGNVLVAKVSGELVMFDPKTNGIQELEILGTPSSFYICNFEETLVLLGRQNVIFTDEKEVGGNDCDKKVPERTSTSVDKDH